MTLTIDELSDHRAEYERNGRPLLLDLFCGAGGAAMGYYRAGFDVVGVDIKPQPRYPFEFIQGNALNPPVDLACFDAIHASPPCQAYSVASARWKPQNEYPDLLDATRDLLATFGGPTCIENVLGAPLWRGSIALCGLMFDLGVVRHRIFESPSVCFVPAHPRCSGVMNRDLVSVTGYGPLGRYYVTVAGHGGNSQSFKLSVWKEAMGIDWMLRDELTQAIPPAYTEFIGKQLIAALEAKA